MIAPRADIYVIRVGSDRLPQVSGSFHLVITVNAEPDEARLRYSEASNLEVAMSPKDRVELFESAANLFLQRKSGREAGMSALAASTLIAHRLSDSARAQSLLDLAKRTLSESDALLFATALNLSASLRAEIAGVPEENTETMAADFLKARRIYQSHGSDIGMAEVDLYRGVALYRMVDKDGNSRREESARAWQEVERTCHRLHETGCEALALSNLGVYRRDSGEISEAFERFYRASTLVTVRSDPNVFADVQDNLAFALSSVLSFDQAIEHHRLAMDAYEKYGECSGVSRSLYGIGYSLLGIGDVEQAKRFYKVALERSCTSEAVASASGSHNELLEVGSVRTMCEGAVGIANSDKEERLNALWAAWDLGSHARMQQDYAGAIACHQLAMKLAPTPISNYGAQLEYVEDLLKSGEEKTAVEAFAPLAPNSAGNMTRPVAPLYMAKAWELDAYVKIVRGESQAAQKSFVEAESRYEALGDVQGQFEVATARARLARGMGQGAVANRHFERADELLRKISLASIDPTYRGVLFSSRRQMYEDWMHSLLQSPRHDAGGYGRELMTLSVSDRSRSRVLADLIKAYAVDRDARWARRLFSPSDEVSEILRAAETERAGTQDDIERSRLNFNHETRVAAASAIIDPRERGIAVNELRVWQRSLPPTASVVEYMLGEQASYAWVLRRDTVVRVELANATEIATAAASVRAAMVSTRGDVRPALARMYDLVLQPVREYLHGTELDVVADGPLYGIPFAALWDRRSGTYLAQGFAIRHLPSIHFAVTRTTKPGSGVAKRALLIGDPVYDLEDARQRCASADARMSRESPPPQSTYRRLRGTGTEVDRIAASLGRHSIAVDMLTGCAANQARVLAKGLGAYRYIHFATHATANEQLPQHSAIHLAAYDESGRYVNGEFTAAQLFETPLNAELVVLSGCSTGGGRSIQGEGVLGLSFAALALGSRYVVSTLWSVADVPSVMVMERFYVELFAETASAAEALRTAQLTLLNDPKWESPRYWGAYILVGT